MIATLQEVGQVLGWFTLMAVVALAIAVLDRRDRAMDQIDPDEDDL